MKSIDTVVCVHGYLSHGLGMYLIKRRLEREYGMRALLFSYASVSGTLDENATALSAFIHEQQLDGIHIIGHSLGGVLALRALATDPDSLPGRVVCLGSPLTGSRAAKILGEFEWAEEIIGQSLPDGVIHQAANEWAAPVVQHYEIGVIAAMQKTYPRACGSERCSHGHLPGLPESASASRRR